MGDQSLTTQPAASAAPRQKSLLRRVFTMGPGMVFVLGAVGSGDIISGSLAGSIYGYRLLWLLLAALIVRLVILDATARYVMVSGQSILAGFGHVSKWFVVAWCLIQIVKRHLSALGKVVILGAAAHLVFPLPTRHSVIIWALASWVAGFALMYWGRYRVIEKSSKPIAALMGASLVASAILSRPAPSEMLADLLSPALPAMEGIYSPVLIVIAVLVAASPPDSNLNYSAYVHEKGWRDLSFLGRQRLDLVVSMSGMVMMLATIQIAAAGALRPLGIQVTDLDDLIPIFAGVLGSWGGVVFGVMVWSLAFSSYLGTSTAYGIMFSDVYYRFVKKTRVMDQQGHAAGNMPAFRWTILYIALSPLYVFLTDWTLIGIVLVKAVVNFVLLPLITLPVLRLTADKKIMGAQANGWFTNGVLVLILAASVYLGYLGVIEFLRSGN